MFQENSDDSLQQAFHEEVIELYEFNYNIFNKISNLVGLGVLNLHFKITFIGKITLSWVFYYLIAVIYTVFIDAHDVNLLLEDSTVFGFGFQAAQKVYIVLKNQKLVRSLFERNRTFYSIENRSVLVLHKMKKLLTASKTLMKLIGALYVFASSFVAVAGFFIYLVLGERVLLIGVKMPFIDSTSATGYIIHTFYHIVALFLAAIGLFVTDIAVVFLILMTYAINIVIIADLNEICDSLEMKETHEVDIDEVTSKMSEVLKLHKYMIQYVSDMEGLLKPILIGHTSTSVHCIATCIIIILTGNWPQAYVVILLGFYQLLSFCIMGTVLEIFNDKLTEAIYECKWYLLPVKVQKMVLLFLYSSQRPQLLTIMEVAPLNVATGLQILKTLYSFAMMLVNALE